MDEDGLRLNWERCDQFYFLDFVEDRFGINQFDKTLPYIIIRLFKFKF